MEAVSIKKHISADRILTILLTLILIFTFLLWATQGRYLYQGRVYFTSSDAGTPAFDNISFISASENSDIYTAKLFGIFPLGDVQVENVKRPEVYLGTGCVVLNASSNEVTVLGFVDENSPAEKAGILAGDIITQVEGEDISSIADIAAVLNKNETGVVDCTVLRGERTYILPVKLTSDKKLGVYISNNTLAVGTLSFITDDLKFCAIGHNLDNISVSDTETALAWASQGSSELDITSAITQNTGTTIKATDLGVFGTARTDWVLGDRISLGWSWEIQDGDAIAHIVTDGSMQDRPIKIQGKGIYNSKEYYKVRSQGATFCKGMSGSAIIQNDRLIGVLIGVNAKDPYEGYFIPVEEIYSEFIGFEGD